MKSKLLKNGYAQNQSSSKFGISFVNKSDSKVLWLDKTGYLELKDSPTIINGLPELQMSALVSSLLRVVSED
jgi:hypothetical protein